MAEVTVQMRHANLVIRKIAKSLSNAKVLERVGGEVANEARNNAYSRPGRSFWRSMGDSVSMQKTGKSVVVVGATHEAAAQKQFGGPIEAPGKGPGALGAKALTIPLGEARENRWNTRDAKEKFNLFPVKSNGKSLLFGTLKSRSKKNAEAQPLFLLKKRVMQQADPWFPEGGQLERAISRGIEDYRKIAGGF